jgi:hypothetical protein
LLLAVVVEVVTGVLGILVQAMVVEEVAHHGEGLPVVVVLMDMMVVAEEITQAEVVVPRLQGRVDKKD